MLQIAGWLSLATGIDWVGGILYLGSAVVLGAFFSWWIRGAQEATSNHVSTFKTPAQITFANFPLAKASHIDKPKVKGWGGALCPS